MGSPVSFIRPYKRFLVLICPVRSWVTTIPNNANRKSCTSQAMICRPSGIVPRKRRGKSRSAHTASFFRIGAEGKKRGKQLVAFPLMGSYVTPVLICVKEKVRSASKEGNRLYESATGATTA